MYATLWRVLLGPVWVRVLILAAGAVAVLCVLAAWVFPWLESLIDVQDATVGG